MAGSIKIAGHELVSHDIANDKLIYGTGVPAGTVIQVQTAVSTTYLNGFANGSFVDTGLNINITPKFSNSKIYLHHSNGMLTNASSTTAMRFIRSAPTTKDLLPAYIYNVTGNWVAGLSSIIGFDTPNTTLQCTYKVQVYKAQGDIYWNYNGPGTGFEAQFIAMEIKQ